MVARPSALVGREPEQDRLAAAARAARAGRGKIVLVSGEPGIGKTALLTSLVAQAAAEGARVAFGAAEELEQRVPFAAVTDCLGLGAGATGRGTAEIAALLRGSHRPPGGTFPTADAEFLITEAILGLVDGWCAAGAVVLAMDDLQWADPASLLVLHRLGRVAGQLPLLIAATRRSGAGGTDVERLVRSWEARDADLVSLGPLDERSVATLTGQAIGAKPAPGLLGMITAAAGNPLFVIELARALVSGTAGDGAGAGGATVVPGSLITVVTRRLAGLSDRAREILPVAAVLGPGFTVAELSAVLATPALELVGVVQEAVAAGVLTAESDRLVFRHEVIRQALRESLPASARNALHLQAGQALAAAGAPVERAAQHLLAGMTLDTQTLAWLARSAGQLSARAPALAADLLRRAVDTAGPCGDQAVPLRLALASALLRVGRFAEAEAAATEGLAALIAVHRQDRDELARLRAALDRPLATGTIRHTIDDQSWARALAVLADGDPEASFGVLSQAWQQCVTGNREYCGHYLLPDMAALAAPLGETAVARRAVADLDRYLADRDAPALHRSARFAAGILDGDPGGLLGVAAAYAAAGRPLLAGQAREHAADLLAAAGRTGEARIQLGAAQDCYARLDAAWDAARADARLRAHGIRRGTHGPRRRPKSGWAALTETERKVAALLAEGLSNPDIAARMFTSRRTVQYHVSNILAKLGLSSRVELATLVARRAG
jgi:DNA-binding CsgD family transcriptional regulator